MNRMISLLALMAVLAASAGPAFATTRPETPPPTEHKGDGDSKRDTVEYRMPKSSRGMTCEVTSVGSNGVSYVEVVNGTGKDIPAGSTVTIYAQPGNVEKLFTLDQPWPAGQAYPVPLKGITLAGDASCSIRVKFPAPPPEPPQLPPPVHTLEEGEIEMGDTGPVGNFPNGGVMSASCEMINQGEVHLNNSGNLDWPQGTYFEVTLSNGMVFTVTTGGFSPEGDMMIPPEYLFPPDGIPDLGESLPLDFMCDIKMVLPNDMGQTP